MCIRDRLFSDSIVGRVENGKHAPGATIVNNAVAITRGTDAVSYTHLRAHETVLDLVCRLLLEKTKKTKTKNKKTRRYLHVDSQLHL